ncbi:MAG: CHASE3 domain-containing protein [Sphingobium sp.]
MVIGIIMLAATAFSAIWLWSLQQEANGWVRHTLEVQQRLNRVLLLVTSAETGTRGYLLTDNPDYLRPYEDATARLPEEITALHTAIGDNERQGITLDQVDPAIHKRIEMLAVTVALKRMGQANEAGRLVGERDTIRLSNRIREGISAMIQEEQRLLDERERRAETITTLAQVVLIGSAIMVVIFGLFIIPDRFRQIREIEATNRQLQLEIAERSEAQSQVRQLQKMDAVGQLTGGIAHDFNNMLAIVIGSLDIARRRLTGDEHPRIASAIDHAAAGAQRAATLTARLLAFARRQPLEPRVVDANRLVGGMSEMLRRTIGESVRVETVLSGGLWQVHADPAQIENTLLNLAVNARDAMPEGGKLTIETGNAELDDRYARAHEDVTAGQYVMISVTDTGTGMPPDVIERAFEPFFTTKPVGQGTGLGLSQVFGFAKQSHGHIKIYSEAGRGTTIKFYLPRHVGPDPLIGVVAAEADDDRSLPGGRVEEIVLVVEDEGQVQRMSVDVLRELGYTVIHADDGQQALAKIADNPHITLLFTDVIMPGMTGRELADRVKVDHPGIRILYTTGYTRNAIVHSGVVDHDVQFLSKPFTIAALARKVREVLDA